MIRYTQGNLLEAPVEALVNTVNEVGVMGKGIALLFRDAFPENTRAYQEACRAREVRVGRMLVTENPALVGPRWIINFPTKRHWRHPSRLEWLREGLVDLARVVRQRGIRSLALPPLGCGSGGLQWEQVRREIEAGLAELDDVDILVFQPTDRYYNAPKRGGVEELTPARALMGELVRRYSLLANECTNLEVHKLAWFLDRVIGAAGLSDPLALQFTANKYGPYAERLRHLLDGLDGSYLHCEKRLGDAGPFDLIWFEPSKRDAVQLYLEGPTAREFEPALARTLAVLDGFESALGLELLGTVDWLVAKRHCEPTVPAVREGLAQWPSGKASAQRKLQLLDERLVGLAIRHLLQTGIWSRGS